MADVRRAIAAGEPLALLALASTLLTVVDPSRRPPFPVPDQPDGPTVSREELLGSFFEVDRPETSALLAVMAELDGDELLRARVRRELTSRSATGLPGWIAELPSAVVERSMVMTHVLGDGDSVLVGIRLASGERLSAMVFVDHNLGSVAKDGMVVPEGIDALVESSQAHLEDPDIRIDELDPADARARLRKAIDHGAITFPPFESETWPACRPLVEWILRRLPEGGSGYERPEWSDEQRLDLTAAFLASPFGAGLDDADHRGLMDSLLWFATAYGPGDPLRWSPAAVEILLADWIPRKVIADVRYLAKAPAVLRAFIRYCHHERGIRAELTRETLETVDELEPDYQRTIRSPRPQGPAALMAAMGAFDPDVVDDLDDELDDDGWGDLADLAEVMLEALRRAVGGEAALARLDDEPLPEEPFDWSGIPDDIVGQVGEVLALCDRCCDELLDGEFRTACRRLLARVATAGPEVFRRRARSDTAAAAICWAIGKANDLFSPSGRRMYVKDLAAHFGLKSSNLNQRATTLLRAGGFGPPRYYSVELGTPDLLVSSRRRRIMELRERYVEIVAGDE